MAASTLLSSVNDDTIKNLDRTYAPEPDDLSRALKMILHENVRDSDVPDLPTAVKYLIRRRPGATVGNLATTFNLIPGKAALARGLIGSIFDAPAYVPPSRVASPPRYTPAYVPPSRAASPSRYAPAYVPPSRAASPPRYAPPPRAAPSYVPAYVPPPRAASPPRYAPAYVPPSRAASPPRYAPPPRAAPSYVPAYVPPPRATSPSRIAGHGQQQLRSYKYNIKVASINKLYAPDPQVLNAVAAKMVGHRAPMSFTQTLGATIDYVVDSNPDVTVEQFAYAFDQEPGYTGLATALRSLPTGGAILAPQTETVSSPIIKSGPLLSKYRYNIEIHRINNRYTPTTTDMQEIAKEITGRPVQARYVSNLSDLIDYLTDTDPSLTMGELAYHFDNYPNYVGLATALRELR